MREAPPSSLCRAEAVVAVAGRTRVLPMPLFRMPVLEAVSVPVDELMMRGGPSGAQCLMMAGRDIAEQPFLQWGFLAAIQSARTLHSA